MVEKPRMSGRIMGPWLPFFLVGLAPTAAVLLSFGSESQISFVLSKGWLLAVPVLWHLKIDGKPWSWSKPTTGLKDGAMHGLWMSAVILVAFFAFRGSLSPDLLSAAVEPVGLTDWRLYLVGAIYWIFINSVLEEYVFRWFLVTKAEEMLGDERKAIIASAAIFVLHHTVAMAIFGFPWWANLLASIGLFVGGAIFSWLYVRHRSIWVPWLAHALCDVAVFTAGAFLLFT
jgi:membrane protease YdiL (CAAX protease family)